MMKQFFRILKKWSLESVVFFLPKDKKERFKKWVFYGHQRFCPICKSWLKKFYTLYFPKYIDLKPRPEAVCPVCGSIERIRLLWYFLENDTDLLAGPRKKLLHIAPEAAFAQKLKNDPFIDYLSADLDPARVMVQMDLTDIHLPDDVFDVIICSHVMEHIQDHEKALRELHRVLRPGGWAVIQVPIISEKTFEDPDVRTPKDRERVYGLDEHVRGYGRDYADILAKAGFEVHVQDIYKDLEEGQARTMGFPDFEEIYFVRK